MVILSISYYGMKHSAMVCHAKGILNSNESLKGMIIHHPVCYLQVYQRKELRICPVCPLQNYVLAIVQVPDSWE
jgi:hypothetical protein